MQLDENGSYFDEDDPGEPSTGIPRLSVTEEEAKILSAIAAHRKVLEIGTGLGVSTRALAKWAKWVVTIDIDPWVHENVFPDLEQHGNVSVADNRDDFPHKHDFDIVFIDGDHNLPQVKEDIRFARSHCHGIIVCHDAKYSDVSLATDGWLTLDTTHGLAIWPCQ